MTDDQMAEDTGDLDRAEYRALQADLQDAGRLEAVPPDLVAAAKAAIMWRSIDAELAELTYDSQLAGAGARSGGATRMLTFEAPGLLIEIESLDATPTAGAGPRRRLMGQIVPPGPGRIEVRHRGGVIALDADEVGRFSADAVEPGPISIRCEAASGTAAIITDWFLV